jgi:hypothetical protein
MGQPDQIIQSIETLTGGIADRFVVAAGPGLPVELLTGPEAKTALGVTDGADGAPGADGADGSPGADGEDGLSAYEIAVAEGFVGDETAWLASLVGPAGPPGDDGADGATGADGPNTVTTSTTTNLTGLIEGNGSTIVARALGVGADTSVPTRLDADGRYVAKTETRYQTIALSGSGANIASGAKKGVWPIKEDIRIVSVSIDCDPANEPSSVAVEVDANRMDRSTGSATSILSAVASIATGANTGTGTVNGTQDFDAGSMMTFDVDQGSDGKELLVSVGYTKRY